MSLLSSTNFASASASGTDWRDTSKAVLEQLDSIRTKNDGFNFGFLYISDYLADDAGSIYNLFKSVLKIDNWIGSIGMGVIGSGESLVDKPAISAMIGHFPDGSFCVFPKDKSNIDFSQESALDKIDIELIDIAEGNREEQEMAFLDEDLERQGPRYLSHDVVQQWLIENTPMLSVVHIDPLSPHNPQETLEDLELSTNSFFVGGLTSSRSHHYQIANGLRNNAVCGAFFADNVPVATALSQGCSVIDGFHIVTKTDNNVILELNDRRALDVLQDTLRLLACKKLGKETVDFDSSFSTIKSSDHIPPEFKSLFRGQVHIGLPLNQSDQNDFLARNIAGIDVDEGSITLAETVETGQRLLFVERDNLNISSDLSKTLINLRNRIMAERGSFKPKAALYISCIAHGFSEQSSQSLSDISLIRDIIGDIPLCGFHAGGEINNARFYGYASVITLFF
ncbi:MAG: FIST C-terminal domain-containing protein [Alphaproteobacteria bacterium]|nr:FIST C-terminal domain-containing protein [Alphaproteobacteria bacterium]